MFLKFSECDKRFVEKLLSFDARSCKHLVRMRTLILGGVDEGELSLVYSCTFLRHYHVGDLIARMVKRQRHCRGHSMNVLKFVEEFVIRNRTTCGTEPRSYRVLIPVLQPHSCFVHLRRSDANS